MLDPRYRMSPPVGLYRRSSRRPNVVFPEPVSPTSASVSPRRIDSDTPSTALSTFLVRRSEPCPTLKYLVTSRVSMSGTSAGTTWSLLRTVAARSASDIGSLGFHVCAQPEPPGARPAVDVEDRACDVGGIL